MLIKLKEKTIVTYIIVVMSAILSIFTNTRYFCRTTVLIEYQLDNYSQGNLQLFFKDSISDFSEDASIHKYIVQSGIASFEIPSKNIDELRIDTDGIGMIAINKIEITSRIGFSEVIDSSNWGSHYISQNDMESIFDDSSKICYKASGADPFVVFKTSLHEASSYGRIIFSIALMFLIYFTIIYFIYIKFGKYFKEQKFRQLAIRILFCCIFVVCLIRTPLYNFFR